MIFDNNLLNLILLILLFKFFYDYNKVDTKELFTNKNVNIKNNIFTTKYLPINKNNIKNIKDILEDIDYETIVSNIKENQEQNDEQNDKQNEIKNNSKYVFPIFYELPKSIKKYDDEIGSFSILSNEEYYLKMLKIK